MTMLVWAAGPVRAIDISYSDGYVDVDFFHKASMHLAINGTQVKGTLDSNAIVQENVRLPGARMELTGTLSGKWEAGGTISGNCTGDVLWPSGSEPRSGQFWISKDDQGIQFRSTKFYYNRYVFKPAGVDYTPSGGTTNAPTNGTGNKTAGAVRSSVILLFDASGSMNQGADKFARFKATAKSSLSPIGPSCEVALITFSDCNQIAMVREFTPMTDDAKKDFSQAIDALTVGSGTPLAQAITFAGDYMKSSARGAKRQIVLLSDGVDTCNGDPAAAAGGLNIKQIGKTKKPPKDPPDLDEIAEILVAPDRLVMKPGDARDVPEVVAVMAQDGEKKTVPADDVRWRPGDKSLTVENGKIRVSDKAKIGAVLDLTAVVKRQKDELTATCKIEIKKEVQLGVVNVTVDIEFSPPFPEGTPPTYPDSVEVELRGPTPRVASGSNGKVHFENVDPGNYTLWFKSIRLPTVPDGYKPRENPPCAAGSWFKMPENRWSDQDNRTVDKWTNHVPIRFRMRNDDEADRGCLFGVVTYNNKPAVGVRVSVAKTGASAEGTTDGNGKYRIKIDGLESGTYWIRAERIVIPRWTDPEDLLDAASYRDQRTVSVNVPVGPGGQRTDIECVKRGGISVKDDIPVIEKGPVPGGGAP